MHNKSKTAAMNFEWNGFDYKMFPDAQTVYKENKFWTLLSLHPMNVSSKHGS